MAKFKLETVSITNFCTKSNDIKGNEKNGWPDIKDGEYDFDHPLQRREKQWSALQQSELIESLMREFVIPPVYTIDEKRDYGRVKPTKKKVVIDGKQRLTTIRSYIKDGFALHKSIKPMELDGVEYEVAGKKFSELDPEVQEVINAADILIYSCPVDDISNNEVKEIFRRLNNGKQLTNAQKNSVYIDEDLGRRIFDILENMIKCDVVEEIKKAKRRGRPKAGAEAEQEENETGDYVRTEENINFFGDVAVVGNGAIKNGDDRNLVIQCAMLMSNYRYGDFDFQDASIKAYLQDNEITEGEENEDIIHEREAVFNKIKEATEALTRGIIERRGIRRKGSGIAPEKNLKKVNIPQVVYGMSVALEHGNGDVYINRLIKFFDNYDTNYEYTTQLDGGTANKDKVQYRTDYFKSMAEQEVTDEEREELRRQEEESQELARKVAEAEAAREAAREAERKAAKEEEEKQQTKKAKNRRKKKAEVEIQEDTAKEQEPEEQGQTEVQNAEDSEEWN